MSIGSVLCQNRVYTDSGELDDISGPLISPLCKLNDQWGKGKMCLGLRSGYHHQLLLSYQGSVVVGGSQTSSQK